MNSKVWKVYISAIISVFIILFANQGRGAAQYQDFNIPSITTCPYQWYEVDPNTLRYDVDPNTLGPELDPNLKALTQITEDDDFEAVNIGFQFMFFGTSVETLYISSNGYLTFGFDEADCWKNNDLNDRNTPYFIIAPYWDDLMPDPYAINNPTKIYAWLDPTTPERFIVQWDDIRHVECPESETISFQVVLEKGEGDTDRIEFHYKEVIFDSAGDGYSKGNSATVGLRSAGVHMFSRQFSHNKESLSNEMAIAFDLLAPSLTGCIPVPNAVNVAFSDDPNQTIDIEFTLEDAGSGVDPGTISLFIQGREVTEGMNDPTSLDAENHGVRFSYTLSAAYSYGDPIHVEIWAADVAGNRMDYDYSFTMAENIDEKPPFIDGREPAPNATGVYRYTDIIFHIKDTWAGVDPNSIQLWVEDEDVTNSASISPLAGDVHDVLVTYDPELPFAFDETIDISVEATDLASVDQNFSYSFSIESPPSEIPPSDPNFPYVEVYEGAVPHIMFYIKDDGAGVDPNSIQLWVEGEDVTDSVAVSPVGEDYQVVWVEYDSPGPFLDANSVEVRITAADYWTASPNLMDKTYYFTIGDTPECIGYSVNPIHSYQWLNPPDPNASRLEITGDDDFEEVGLVFPFKFFNQPFESVPYIKVSSNGYLSLGGDSGTLYENNDLNLMDSNSYIIAPFWDDLRTVPGVTNIYAWLDDEARQSDANAPRRFIVQWNSMDHYHLSQNDPYSADTISFEVVLYENSTIVFNYKDVLFSDPNEAQEDGYSMGNSATVGLRMPMASRQYSYNEKSLSNGKAIAFDLLAAQDVDAPSVTGCIPDPNAVNVVFSDDPNQTIDIEFTLEDAGSGVDPGSISLFIQEREVTAGMNDPTSLDAENHGVRFSYTLSTVYSYGDPIHVEIWAADAAGNWMHRAYSFTMADMIDERPPFIDGREPGPNATGVYRYTDIIFHIKDTWAGVDPGSIQLEVKGKNVTGSADISPVAGDVHDVLVTYDPEWPFAFNETINISVKATDLAFVDQNFSYSFSIESPPDDSNPPYLEVYTGAVPHIMFYIKDDGAGVDPNSIQLQLWVDSNIQWIDITNSATVSPAGEDYQVVLVEYDSPGPFADANSVGVKVTVADLAASANWMKDETYYFTIGDTLEFIGYAVDPNYSNQWLDPPDPNASRLEITGDDDFEEVVLGFPFKFFGQPFESAPYIRVSSNGYLSLGDDSASLYENDNLNSINSPFHIIAPFWDDLRPVDGATNIYAWLDDEAWQADANAPRRFIVQWNSMDHFNLSQDPNSVNAISFEVVLYENNKIVFNYHDVLFSDLNDAQEDGYSYGQSASVGLRGVWDDTNDTLFSQSYSYNVQSLDDELAICFTPSNGPRQVDEQAPYILSYVLDPNVDNYPRNPNIQILIHDPNSGTGVDLETVRLYIQGRDVTHKAQIRAEDGDMHTVRVSYQPLTASDYFDWGQTVFVSVAAADLAVSPNWMNYGFSFPIISSPVIGDQMPPYLDGQNPAPGAANVSPYTNIVFHIKDEGDGVDPNSVRLLIQNDEVTDIKDIIDQNGYDSDDLKVIYNPPLPFVDGNLVQVTVMAKDLAESPNTMEETYQFTLISLPGPLPEVIGYTWDVEKDTNQPYDWWLDPPDPNRARLDIKEDDDYAIAHVGFKFLFFGQPFECDPDQFKDPEDPNRFINPQDPNRLIDPNHIIYVSSNGYLTFGADSATRWNNNALEEEKTPSNIIAPFWDDLMPDPNANNYPTKIYAWLDDGAWQADANVPRRFIVQWNEIAHHDLWQEDLEKEQQEQQHISFQVILYEDKKIEFYYKDVIFEDIPYKDIIFDGGDDYSYGESASIGLRSDRKDRDGEIEVFSSTYAPNVCDGKVITFTPAGDTTLPEITNCFPGAGAENVPRDTAIQFFIKDDGSGVDLNSIILEIGPIGGEIDVTGKALIQPLDDRNRNVYVYYHDPDEIFTYSEKIWVSIGVSDMADSKNSIDKDYHFIIEDDPEKKDDIDAPYLVQCAPAPWASGVSPNTNIFFHIKDDGAGVNKESVRLWVDDNEVDDTRISITPVRGDKHDLLVRYDPPGPFAYGTTINIKVEANDLAILPDWFNSMEETYDFTITKLYTLSSLSDPNIWLEPDNIDPLPQVNGAGSDDSWVEVNIGFPFQLFGQPFENDPNKHTIYISSNGYLTIADDSAASYVNNNLNYPDAPFNIIAPFWDDLNPGLRGNIYAWPDDDAWQADANAPRRFIVQWNSIGHYLLPESKTVSFEVVLSSDNTIEFHYKDVIFSPLNPTTDGYSYGQSASVGLRSVREGDIFSRQYSYNTGLLYDGLSLYFTPTTMTDGLAPPSSQDKESPVITNPNSIWDPNSGVIEIHLEDPNSGVDLSTIKLYVQGQDITDEAQILPLDNDFHTITVIYSLSAAFFPAKEKEVPILFVACDMADSPNWMHYTGSFNVEPFSVSEDSTAPYLDGLSPPDGALSVLPRPRITLYIKDDESLVDKDSITLIVHREGVTEDVTDEVSMTPESTESHSFWLVYDPVWPFNYGEEVHVEVRARNRAVPPVEMNETYQFTIIDAFGYDIVPDCKYDWLEPPPDNSELEITGDDDFREVDIGFPFQLFGQPFENDPNQHTIYVSSNGYLTCRTGFVDPNYSATRWSNNDLNAIASPTNIIAPFWDDLEPVSDPNGTRIYAWLDDDAWQIDANAPRRFIVQWKSIGHYRVWNDAALSFEAVLYEDNRIEFRYKNVFFSEVENRYNEGASATVGLRSVQEDYLFSSQYSYNSPALYNDLGICFIPSKEALSQDSEVPILIKCIPKQDATNVFLDEDTNKIDFSVIIQDFGSGVDPNTIELWIGPEKDIMDDVTDECIIQSLDINNYHVKISYGYPTDYFVKTNVQVVAFDMAFPERKQMQIDYSFTTEQDPTTLDDANSPYLSGEMPAPGSVNVSRNTDIKFNIEDDGKGVDVDPNTIDLMVNDVDVTDEAIITRRDRRLVSVVYDPPGPFIYGERVKVNVTAKDLDKPAANEMSKEYAFTIERLPEHLDYTLTFPQDITIPEPGPNATLPQMGDDDFEEVDIGFRFMFFGLPVDTVYISSNGYLTFGEDPNGPFDAGNYTAYWRNNDLDLSVSPPQIIAPFWDDLKPVSGPNETRIYAWLDDVDPNAPRRFIVRWDSIGHYYADSNEIISFEAMLCEGSHEIIFHYDDVKFAGNGYDQYSYGQSATAGIRSVQPDQTVSQQYSFNSPSLYDGLIVSFAPSEADPLTDSDAPAVTNCSPAPNAVGVSPNTNIRLFIHDSGTGVDRDSVQLWVEGENVTDDAQIESLDIYNHNVEVFYDPPATFYYNQTVDLQVIASDMVADPNTNRMAVEYSFTIASSLPVGDVDAPYLEGQSPPPGAIDISPYSMITLYIKDDEPGVDPNSITLTVQGFDVTDDIALESIEPHSVRLIYDPNVPFDYGEEVRVEVRALDLADDPIEMNEEYLFTIRDSFGYSMDPDYSYQWLESPDPTNNALRNMGDDDFEGVNIGFPFMFYGRQYETVYVSSNGYITFDGEDAAKWNNNNLNTKAGPFDIIAPFWDDLKPNPQTKINAWLDEANSARRFIIQWDSIGSYRLGEDETISFEVIFDEQNNGIVFQYKDVKFAAGGNDEFSYGKSATVGLRSVQGSHLFYQQYSYNQPALSDHQSICFVPLDSPYLPPQDEEPPYILGEECLPAPNAVNVLPDPNIHLFIYDTYPGVDLTSVRLYVDGNDVTGEADIRAVNNDIHKVEVFYQPLTSFDAGQTISISVTADDTASPPNGMSYAYSFTIQEAFIGEDHTPPDIIPQHPIDGDLLPLRDVNILLHVIDEGVGVKIEEDLLLLVEYAGESKSLIPVFYVFGDNTYEVTYPTQVFPPAEIINITVMAEDRAGNEAVHSYSFTTLPDINPIPLLPLLDYPVKAIVYDDMHEHEKLWVGTEGAGLFEYDLSTGTNGAQYTDTNAQGLSSKLSSNFITSMTMDHDGYLWIGTDQGLDQFDPNTSEVKNYNFENGNFPPDSINDLAIDNDNVLWAATQSSGLIKMTDGVDERTYSIFIDTNNQLLVDAWIEEIAFDGTDTLWIGAGSNEGIQGVYKICVTDVSPMDIVVDDLYPYGYAIESFFCDPDRNLWIGTRSLSDHGLEERVGIYRYDQNGLPLPSININLFPDLDSDGIIYAVHMTESSNVFRFWFATNNGLKAASADLTESSTNLTEWLSLNNTDLADQVIYCIAEDGAGNLWVGSETGLYKVNMVLLTE